MKRAVGFALVALWMALACACQLLLLALAPRVDADAGGLARALVPDLGVCVLVAAVARVGRRDVLAVALAATVGRVAFSGASPFALLAGQIAVASLAAGLARAAELDRPALRFTGAGLGALVSTGWLLVVDLVRAGESRARGALSFGAVDSGLLLAPFATAVTTALVAFALWPIFRALPGLRRLERRAF